MTSPPPLPPRVWLLLLAILLAPAGSPSPSPRPVVDPPRQPDAEASGVASWYRWRHGEAAAGPALRRVLGPAWRGRTVLVHHGGRSVRVVLTDWCQCYRGRPDERIIDLDARAFAALAPLSSGLIRVEVTVTSARPRSSLPPGRPPALSRWL